MSLAMNYRSFGPGAEHHDPALEGVEAHRQVSVLQGLAGMQDIIYSHQKNRVSNYFFLAG
jgi:hypothetical protein